MSRWNARSLAGVPVLAVGVFAGIISYNDILSLALTHNFHGAPAHLLPLVVDMLIVAGSVMLLWPAAEQAWLGWICVGPGVAATVFANIESQLPHGWISATVAAWAAAALCLATFTFERWLRAQLRPQPATQPATLQPPSATLVAGVAGEAAEVAGALAEAAGTGPEPATLQPPPATQPATLQPALLSTPQPPSATPQPPSATPAGQVAGGVVGVAGQVAETPGTGPAADAFQPPPATSQPPPATPAGQVAETQPPCGHEPTGDPELDVRNQYLHGRDCLGEQPSVRKLAETSGLSRYKVAELVGPLNGSGTLAEA